MSKNKLFFRIFGTIMFLFGIGTGMALFGSAAWADLESTFFGFEKMGGERLGSLNCPILMSISDVSTVGATFKNPNDVAVEFMTRIDVSHKGLFRTERSTLFLEANKSGKVGWLVNSDDIDMGIFIFAQVSSYPARNMPFRDGTCGIVVVNFPQFTGKQIFWAAMLMVIIGILGGLLFWEASGIPFSGRLVDTTRAMKVLGVLVLLGLFFSLQGVWIMGIILFAFCVLAIGVILGFYLAE